MSDIENIIKQKSLSFDTDEPCDEHLDLFKQKLQLHQLKKSKWEWKNLMQIAAIIAIVLLSGLASYQIREIKPTYFSLGQVSPEYNEVENYFNSSINKQLNIIKQLSESSDVQDQKIIKEELASMDKMYNQLKRELRVNPKDERIIQAMIEHFQVKNNILNRIVEQLYLIKQQNMPLASINRI